MDTDRELLEWAAKAAGITGTWQDGPFFGIIGSAIDDMDVPWNPLRNDGQALRLAVACGLVVDCSRPSAGEPFKRHAIWLDETMSNAELARRTIVRAAAEIGKAMV